MMRGLLFFCVLLSVASVATGQILQKTAEVPDTVAKPPVVPASPTFRPQKYLALDKPGRIKRIRYFIGDEIVFRLQGDRLVYRDIIAAIDDSSFTIFGTKVLVREVDEVILRRQSNFATQASVLLPLAGIIYFLADNLNPVISGREKFSVSRGSVVVGASLIGAGVLLRLTQKKRHHLGKNKRLRVLETF